MRLFVLAGSAVVFLLGVLWLLQGLGLVTMEPLLCLANCKPVVGPTITWSIAGAVALMIGLLGVRIGIRRK